MPSVQEICTISIGRTGSTLLAVLLRNNPGVLSLSEVFNASYSFHDDIDVGTRPELALRVISKEHFRTWRDYLGQYREACRKAELAALHYKIVVDSEVPGFVLAFLEFIRDSPDVAFLLLRRDPLDTFVSMKKATETGAFWNQDYTEHKVRFVAAEFCLHLFYQQSVEAYVEALLKRLGARWARLSYEEFGRRGTEEAVWFLNSLLREQFGISLVPGDCSQTLRKQNRLENVRDNFLNPEDFDAFIRQHDLKSLLL